MTENERAIQVLKELRDDCYEDDGYGNMTDECSEELWAIDTAIEALKERKSGKWIKDIYGNVVCSECKRKPICGNLTAYCPHCGAKMEVDDADSN